MITYSELFNLIDNGNLIMPNHIRDNKTELKNNIIASISDSRKKHLEEYTVFTISYHRYGHYMNSDELIEAKHYVNNSILHGPISRRELPCGICELNGYTLIFDEDINLIAIFGYAQYGVNYFEGMYILRSRTTTMFNSLTGNFITY